MQNKVLNKYLLQYYIGCAVFFGIAGTSGVIMYKSAQLHNESSQDVIYDYYTGYTYIYDETKSRYVRYEDTNHSVQLLSIVLITACVLFGYSSARLISSTKRKANTLAKNYLRDLFAKHPELRNYENILNNDEKVKDIAAFACNALSNAEQQEIINTINSAYDKDVKSDFEQKNVISDAHIKICQIINAHAQTHPAYARQIEALIKGSKKTYVFNPNEHTR